MRRPAARGRKHDRPTPADGEGLNRTTVDSSSWSIRGLWISATPRPASTSMLATATNSASIADCAKSAGTSNRASTSVVGNCRPCRNRMSPPLQSEGRQRSTLEHGQRLRVVAGDRPPSRRVTSLVTRENYGDHGVVADRQRLAWLPLMITAPVLMNALSPMFTLPDTWTPRGQGRVRADDGIVPHRASQVDVHVRRDVDVHGENVSPRESRRSLSGHVIGHQHAGDAPGCKTRCPRRAVSSQPAARLDR